MAVAASLGEKIPLSSNFIVTGFVVEAVIEA